MTSNEKKREALKTGRKKMAPGGSRTSEVAKAFNAVRDTFQEYIKSDNISAYEKVPERLKLTIEGHADFETAVTYIDRAISAVQTEINEEKAATSKKG